MATGGDGAAAVGLSADDAARRPSPGSSGASSVCFSPGGQSVTFLRASAASLSNELCEMDLKTGEVSVLVGDRSGAGDTEETLTHEEKLRRERQRNLATGVTQYMWTPSTADRPSRLLIPQQGNLYIRDPSTGDLALVFDKTSTGVAGGAIDPQVSPTGAWTAFVQDREVYVVRNSAYNTEGGGIAVQLTSGARESGKTNGLADFLAQEEMDRYSGIFWSPNGSYIAFEEVDESHIPVYRIMHQGKDEVGEAAGAQEDHRYPFAGAENPRVRLGLVSVAAATGSETPGSPPPDPVWMDLGDDPDIYLARVNWLHSTMLTAQIQSRDQKTLRLVRFADDGTQSLLLEETSDSWINLHDILLTIPTSMVPSEAAAEAGPKDIFFVWASERSGFQHLYLYRASTIGGPATLVRQLTKGEWIVESVVGVDEARKLIFVTGTGKGPLESHLYVVSMETDSLDATGAEPITDTPGMHSVVLNASNTAFVDTFSSLTTPVTTHVKSLSVEEGKRVDIIQVVHEIVAPEGAGAGGRSVAASSASDPFSLVPPTPFTCTAADNSTTLHGLLYKPDPVAHGPGPYPTLVSVYGGPGVQLVQNNWRNTADLRAQRLAQKGFLVSRLDNRGSKRRGVEFEAALHLKMGTVEVDDQVAGVKHLVDEGLADSSRVGIYGWSYGGYMTLMCLSRAPDVFTAGVSGAPVTHWDGYDTHYTERFMSTPAKNPDGYKDGAVMTHAHSLRDEQRLMLIHGLIDENVHFRHTARLINALIKQRFEYELLLFPEERHGPRRPADRAYIELRIGAFFEKTLASSKM